jgi:apoptosis-inducing factor 2
MSVHQIAIIGASFAGLTIAHELLKTVIPAVSSNGQKKFKVIQIAPSDELYFKIGAPRTLINPESLGLDRTLVPFLEQFSKYPSDQYEFIKTKVTSIDPATKTLSLDNGASVNYDSVVISSGTIFNNNLWSNARGTDLLKKELKELHEKLPAAETIVVGGGGPAGVETSGELGDRFGSKKDITLYSGSTQLLNGLQTKAAGRDAEQRLHKQGIKVVHGIQITSHRTEGGKEVLQLSNGETKTVDVYIEAIGDKPNSSFVPKEWLNERGFVLSDAQTLRLSVDGVTGVYAYGSVASYSNGTIPDVWFAKKAIAASMKSDLAGNGKPVSPFQRSVSANVSLQHLPPAQRTSTRKPPRTCASCPLEALRESALPWDGGCRASPSEWPRRKIS